MKLYLFPVDGITKSITWRILYRYNHNWFNAYNLNWVTIKLQKNILKTFGIYVMILKGFANVTWQLVQA
ncbi:unnamed protein product [Urochloa humidicola]